MSWFKKKVSLQFFNTMQGVEVSMPVIPANQLQYEWKKNAAKEYSELKNKTPGNFVASSSNCPGINLFHNQGWIIRAWQDIFIEASDKNNFMWNTPISQKDFSGEETISVHGHDRIKHFNNWPEFAYNGFIKINTGWKCVVPKGFVLYQLPAFYCDEDRFMAVPGCYSPDYGLAEINVPFYWYKMGAPCVIKAGTPLVHLILVPEEKYNFSITKPDHEKLRLQHLIFYNAFVRNYKDIKNFFRSKN